jgi:hypothetical protein
MDNVVYLLTADERFILRAFRQLAIFRQTYDVGLLGPAKQHFVRRFHAAANGALSQAVMIDRALATIGFPQDWLHPEAQGVSHAELVFLDLLRAGQVSLTGLDDQLRDGMSRRRSDVVALIGRFSAMLLAAGIRLPAREGIADRPRPGQGRHDGDAAASVEAASGLESGPESRPGRWA